MGIVVLVSAFFVIAILEIRRRNRARITGLSDRINELERNNLLLRQENRSLKRRANAWDMYIRSHQKQETRNQHEP